MLELCVRFLLICLWAYSCGWMTRLLLPLINSQSYEQHITLYTLSGCLATCVGMYILLGDWWP